MDALARDAEEQPDTCQHGRAACLGCSQRGISDALQRLAISRKKTFRHPKADEASRNAFRVKIKEYQDDGRPAACFDESGSAQDMPRTHGCAPVGRRCFGQHDWSVKGRINAIGALLNKELLTVTLVDGSIDADVFHAWLRDELPPELPRNSVVVMDNAAFHKPDAIQEAVTSCGHELEFLPPCSPDLNPIEHERLRLLL